MTKFTRQFYTFF